MALSKHTLPNYWRIGLFLCLALPCWGEVHVSEADAKSAAIEKPTPTISQTARQLKLSGKVSLTVFIDEKGEVTDAVVTLGSPVLGAGAVTAVKKWKFKPFTENGAPAKATTVLNFEFKQ